MPIGRSGRGLGFDEVLIDCEHGTIDLETVELMVMATEASGVVPIVRPKSGDFQDIVQVMDRGAAGVQVPHVIDGDVLEHWTKGLRPSV